MRHLIFQVLLSAFLGANVALAQNPPVTIQVDTAADTHRINPNVYGLNHADTLTLNALNSPLNRFGGNRRSRYNWQANTDSTASDFFFESFPDAPTPGGLPDAFFSQTKTANAQAMITVPMIDYVATTDAQRNVLCSFSIAKYGPQTGNDAQFHPDCGNGIRANGQFVVNDPLDANISNSTGFQQAFVQHLVDTWGRAANSGVRYYLLDNEHAIWHQTHRDVHPIGASYDEMRQKMIAYASMIKSVDPGALVAGPEEFGWTGYFFSGFEIYTCDRAQAQGDPTCYQNPPDRANHGGVPYVLYLLSQFRAFEASNARRLLDVFTLHYYPAAQGVFAGLTDNATQDLRSRSTRSLWDPTYVDETFINDTVRLIPRMKEWVSAFYPGTPIGVTEYHWGAPDHINGGTTQADVLGIFGREGLDLATLYTDHPLPPSTFIAKAFQIYRNYDGRKSAFGDVSVRTIATPAGGEPLANNFGAFGAIRSSDGAFTLMIVSKYRAGDTAMQASLAGFQAAGTSEVWRLSAANGGAITRLPDIALDGSGFSQTIPPQSVTLFVVRASNAAPRLNDGGAVNGASFAAGPLAPGSLISVFGERLAGSALGAASLPLPMSLAGASLRINNSPAPLLFVSPGQINAQVPWDVPAGAATVTATAGGVSSNTISVTIGPYSPGVFVAVHLDGSPITAQRPAERGQPLVVYATGLGAVSNQPLSGASASADPLSTTVTAPRVTLGGGDAAVLFSGLAPGFVGLYQVNTQVPANAPTGNAVEVVVTIGGISSNKITIAVQ